MVLEGDQVVAGEGGGRVVEGATVVGEQEGTGTQQVVRGQSRTLRPCARRRVTRA